MPESLLDNVHGCNCTILLAGETGRNPKRKRGPQTVASLAFGLLADRTILTVGSIRPFPASPDAFQYPTSIRYHVPLPRMQNGVKNRKIVEDAVGMTGKIAPIGIGRLG